MAMTADQVERAMFSPKNTPAEQLKRTPAEGGATDEAVEEAAARMARNGRAEAAGDLLSAWRGGETGTKPRTPAED